MHYLNFTAAVARPHSERTRARKGTISALIASLMILGTVGADLAFAPLPVKADSEASSESGAYLRQRRGRRYRNNQSQQQNPQSMAIKQELKREAKERNQAQQQQQRNLARGPQIKEYGGHQHRGQFRSGQSNQGASNQSNQGLSNQGQNNQTP